MTLLTQDPDRAGADGATRTPPAPGAGPAPIHLSALRIHPAAPQPRPAPVRRDWMDATDSRFANRCLPLLLANPALAHLRVPAPHPSAGRAARGQIRSPYGPMMRRRSSDR